MTERTASSSRSAIDLPYYGITQAFKRGRTQFESNQGPHISVTPPAPNDSTETTVSTETQDDNKIRYLTRKLDRLNDKEARFQSHKEFLERCLAANVIPNGLKVELEPSIGNHNEDFIANWNDKLNKFSRELMTDVIEFCGKTITATNPEIENTNRELTGQTNQEQINDITATLKNSQQTRKYQYKKNKDKKYYNLKYNIKNKLHRPQTNWSSDEDRNNNQQQQSNNQHHQNNNSYQQNNKQNPPNNNFYKLSNNRNQQSNNQNQSNYASVTRRNISNTNLHSRSNSRRNSNTDLTRGTTQHAGRQNQSNNNNETTMLRQRVQELEQQVKQQSTSNHTEPENIGTLNQVPKNANSAQSHVPGAPLQIHDMLEYITNTMQTLNNFKTQLTQLRGTEQTHLGMS